MVVVVVRRQPFNGAGDEIRHNRIDGYAGAGDEDAGLSRRSNPPSSRRRMSRSGQVVYILPTEQSVPTASSRLPVRLAPVATSKSGSDAGRRTAAGRRFRGLDQSRMIAEGADAGRWRDPCQLQRFGEDVQPSPRKNAAAVGDTDDNRLHPLLPRPGGLKSGIFRSARHPSRRNCPAHQSGRQCTMPWAVFAAS